MAKKSEAKLGGELSLVEDFNGELSTLEPGQYAKHPETRAWFFKTPNGILLEVDEGRVRQEDDGTVSVPLALSGEMVDEEDKEKRVFWTGTIDHGKFVPNE